MLPINELKSLAKVVAKASSNTSAPVAYSFNGKTENVNYSAANETLRKEMLELAGTNALYRENKNTIFSLIEETVTEVLPNRVMDRYAQFAETRVFKQGDRPVFVRRNMGKIRGKQFVTRVGLAGVYEVFKLGAESFEVGTSAIGAAAQIQFEEFLDGRADFAEVINIIMEGMDDFIYQEIAKALITSIDQLPEANKVITNGFNEQAMDHLIQTAAAYGRPSIYCTYEFACKIMPSADKISENMKDKLWDQGYLGSYHGCPIIVLPQSFTDGSNSTKVIDPGFCWVIPSGADGKPVKVAFEGSAQSRERENEDWSRDFQIYQKVGVGVMLTNNICSYVDTTLVGQLDNNITSQYLPSGYPSGDDSDSSDDNP